MKIENLEVDFDTHAVRDAPLRSRMTLRIQAQVGAQMRVYSSDKKLSGSPTNEEVSLVIREGIEAVLKWSEL